MVTTLFERELNILSDGIGAQLERAELAVLSCTYRQQKLRLGMIGNRLNAIGADKKTDATATATPPPPPPPPSSLPAVTTTSSSSSPPPPPPPDAAAAGDRRAPEEVESERLADEATIRELEAKCRRFDDILGVLRGEITQRERQGKEEARRAERRVRRRVRRDKADELRAFHAETATCAVGGGSDPGPDPAAAAAAAGDIGYCSSRSSDGGGGGDGGCAAVDADADSPPPCSLAAVFAALAAAPPPERRFDQRSMEDIVDGFEDVQEWQGRVRRCTEQAEQRQRGVDEQHRRAEGYWRAGEVLGAMGGAEAEARGAAEVEEGVERAVLAARCGEERVAAAAPSEADLARLEEECEALVGRLCRAV